MTDLSGTTPYETWVNTLRAWREDPRTSLDGLPELREEMYTPDTFSRLMAQLMKAMQTVSDRWHEALVKVWEHAQTPHDMARELVSLRATLARRGQLASHPSLPEPVREALRNGFRSDVEKWQAELEEAVRSQHSRHTLNSGFIDTMLRVVRENSLIGVLDYGVVAGGGRPERPALPERDPKLPIVVPGASANRRRIVVPSSTRPDV